MISEMFLYGLASRGPIKVLLHFKPTTSPRAAMAALLSMDRNNVLKIDARDNLVVRAVQFSGMYDHSENQRIRVMLSGHRVDLLRALVPYLDKVEVQDVNVFSGIQTRRVKKREEAAEAIVKQVHEGTDAFFREWDIVLTHRLVEEHGIRLLEFMITLEGDEVHSCRACGMTGRIYSSGFWSYAPGTPKRISQTLLAQAREYLEGVFDENIEIPEELIA